MSEIKPWHDVPLCSCGGPMVTRAEHPRGDDMPPEHQLACLGCGESRAGTAVQVEQAERARAAWEAQDR
jgi:hypothetical protein